MEVVVEQAIGVDLDAVARHGRCEAVVEDLAVVVAAKHRLAANAAVHDVLPCALMVLARGSRHGMPASAREPHSPKESSRKNLARQIRLKGRTWRLCQGARPAGSAPIRARLEPQAPPAARAHDEESTRRRIDWRGNARNWHFLAGPAGPSARQRTELH